ncbi:MAG: hypothetical protein E3J67_04390, partial [Dehalococcoidia bacterium]
KMRPKIISLSYAVPDQAATQEEAWQALGYGDKARHFKRFFTEAEISKRHFWVPLPKIKEMSWQELSEEYLEGAVELSKKAIINCLDGRSVNNIGMVIFVSCTGYSCPSIAHRLDLDFRPDTYFTNIVGMGCEGGFPGLKRAYDYIRHKGKRSQALVVACELCSCTFFPEPDGVPDPENGYEVLRSNAIFADAAAAALVGYDDDLRHPEIWATATYTDTSYLNDLGYVWRDGRLRVVLSRRVPEATGTVAKRAVDGVLKQAGLKVEEVSHWIVHAAGASILTEIRDALGLPEEKMAISRETLRLYGNTSSTSIGITAKLLMRGNPSRFGVVISLGPGLTGGATLLYWGR